MRVSVLLAVALLTATGSACANDDDATAPAVPDVAAPTEAPDYESNLVVPEISASITVDGALREVEGLGEPLIAAAQEAVAATHQTARRRRGAAPDIFEQWRMSIAWEPRYVGPDAASALGVTELSENGEPPSRTYETVTLDRLTGRPVTIADLFVGGDDRGPALTVLAEAALQSWAEQSPRVAGDLALVDERTIQDARDALPPRASAFESFALRASPSDPGRIAGIELYYPAGVLGERSEGPYALFVPGAAIGEHLTPVWAAKFETDSSGD